MSLGAYTKRPVGPPLLKPLRGSSQVEARERTAERKSHERREMDKARRRDGGCRWPACDCRRQNLTVDVCHQRHRSHGGNPSGDRTIAKLLISLCRVKHGAWDRGEIDCLPQTAAGFDGCADFYLRDERGRFYVFASEQSIGVSTMKDGR